MVQLFLAESHSHHEKHYLFILWKILSSLRVWYFLTSQYHQGIKSLVNYGAMGFIILIYA